MRRTAGDTAVGRLGLTRVGNYRVSADGRAGGGTEGCGSGGKGLLEGIGLQIKIVSWFVRLRAGERIYRIGGNVRVRGRWLLFLLMGLRGLDVRG